MTLPGTISDYSRGKTLLSAAVALVCAAMLSFGGSMSVAAAAIDWDRPANIKDAAERLVKLHRSKGSEGVLKFLDACYRTHLLASEFNEGIEACLVQDYIHAQTLATVYSRVPDAVREQRKIPAPDLISKAMQNRLVTTFTQYKITPAEAVTFQKLVQAHGMPLFIKGVFPNADTKTK